MSAQVKACLVAYSQGAPEVMVRMDKASARALRDCLAAAGPAPRPDEVLLVLRRLEALDLEERPRGG